MAKKKAQTDLLNIIFGIIIIAGGFLVALSYVNLGMLLTGIGVVFEGIKLVLTQGIK